MKYGRFDDARREYVIETPLTPFPWINYLGNAGFFSIISNTGGGYSFYRDAALRRLTRFRYNSVPPEEGGRFFYIKDGNEIWNPGYAPAGTELDWYECRHGMGYTSIGGEKRNIRASVIFFVPLGADAEVQLLTVENRSGERRHIELFSCVEFAFWNAQDDATNFQRNLNIGEVEVEGPVIYHKTEYRERRNHFSFYSVNSRIDGFDTDRESFLGLRGGFAEPAAVADGRARNSVADGWSPIGSHWLSLDLAPSESRQLVFILGYVENPESEKWESPGIINKSRALDLIGRYDSAEKVGRELERLREFWNELLSHLTVRTGEERLDRMVNIWNQYQCMATYNIGRSASYFESGIGRGLGFRDTNQDLLGFVHLIPERARERILDVAATQFEDGGCYHQYQPLTKRGNNAIGGDFNDDPLWLIAAVSAYIRETGDWAILEEQVPFDHDPAKAESLFEHLNRSFDHVTSNLGPHGLPLIGRADWNDCLNLNCYSTQPDESFQTTANQSGRIAESVLIAGMFVYIGRDYAEMARRTGRVERARSAGERMAAMERAVVAHGWDGEWFLRAYDGKGAKVGSKECAEGQIFIESQGFCSMAAIGAAEGYPRRALDSVAARLDTRYGIMLQQPAFTRYYLELGEISSYPPGYKENAGIFCHNNPWIMIGEAALGNGERAFEYYRKICPAYLEEISELHRVEPYVYAQMIAGRDAKRHGEAKNSWLTGTAAWNFVAVTQHILGVRPGFDGLILDPSVPADWSEFEVERLYRGARYRIRVRNPERRSKGIRRLEVDGKEVDCGAVPLAAPGAVVVVDAWI